VNTLATTRDIVRSALKNAEGRIVLPDGYTSRNNKMAAVSRVVLQDTIEQQATIRSIQMAIIAEVARKKLWLYHPPTQDYENGYGGMIDFIKDCGFVTDKGALTSTGSYLLSIGEVIVPFCDDHNIQIDEYMTNSLRPKLEYAITEIKSRIKEEDVSGVQEVLGKVRSYRDRESIAAEFHKPRTDRIGRATTVRLPDGRAALVSIVDDQENIEVLVGKLAGVVHWGLPVQYEEDGLTMQFKVYDYEGEVIDG